MSNLHVIVAPSCSGKDVFARHLIDTGHWDLVVSATTRPPRAGEVHGINYLFLDDEDFVSMIDRGDLLEHANFSGKYYGTPSSELGRIRSSGKIPLAIVEPKGARSIQNWCASNNVPLSLMRIDASLSILTKRFCDRFSDDVEKVKSDSGKIPDKLVSYYADRLASSFFTEHSWASILDYDRAIPLMNTEDEGRVQAQKLTSSVLEGGHQFKIPESSGPLRDYGSGTSRSTENYFIQKVSRVLHQGASSNFPSDYILPLITDIQKQCEKTFLLKYQA
jgi:guanylate kinase